MGGCKTFMTGMWAGMLFCRSYGGGTADYGSALNPIFSEPCARFGSPAHPGMYSGSLGDVHPDTGQENVGGQCCTSTDWLMLEIEPPTREVGNDCVTNGAPRPCRVLAILLDDDDSGGVSSSSSSTDTSASSSVLLGIVITFGALVLLYAAFNFGKGKGQTVDKDAAARRTNFNESVI